MPALSETMFARCNQVHGRGNSSALNLLVAHCRTLCERYVISEIGSWRGSKPTTSIMIPIVRGTLCVDVSVFTGGGSRVSILATVLGIILFGTGITYCGIPQVWQVRRPIK